MLRGFYVGVTQHFTHAFNRYSVGQCDGCGESMSCDMKCQILTNIAEIYNFFKIGIHNLIAGNRKQ